MIEVLCGFISSGKSTWAKERAKQGYITINDDLIVNVVHGNEYTLYNSRLKSLYKSIEVHIFHMACAMDLNVLVDKGLNLSKKSRQRWIALARSIDVPVHAVLFEVFDPKTHAQRRFKDDSRGHTLEYWTKVADRHFSIYEEPTVEEGFETITFKSWNKD